jgi:hypothetical protein
MTMDSQVPMILMIVVIAISMATTLVSMGLQDHHHLVRPLFAPLVGMAARRLGGALAQRFGRDSVRRKRTLPVDGDVSKLGHARLAIRWFPDPYKMVRKRLMLARWQGMVLE